MEPIPPGNRRFDTYLKITWDRTLPLFTRKIDLITCGFPARGSFVADLTVLYDGNCAFCSGSAERVRRLDRNHRIALVDLHDPAVPARFPQVDLEEAMRLIKAVDSQGRVSSGIDAWADICRSLPGWRTVGWLLKVPGIHALAGWGYGWIARNRYRWNRNVCNDESCAVHVPGRR